MTQEHRLKGLAGIYNQNDGSTFVVLFKGSDLYLKTDKASEEKLIPGGDGLYRVGDTDAKIKFNISANGVAGSLNFYLKDRQTVATKNLQILKEKSFLEKFKELGIALVLFFALVGLFLLSYSPLKQSCLTGNSKTLCRLALVGAKILGRSEDTLQLTSQESKSEYTQIKEQTKSECDEGKVSACVDIAKSYLRLNDRQKAFTILESACLTKKNPEACVMWHEALLDKGEIDQAYEIAQKACSLNVGISCHELAWKYKKENELSRSISFFTKACENGEDKSCHELGLHHMSFNRRLAYSFFESACKAYHRQACDFKEKIERYFSEVKKCDNENKPRACFIVASFEEDYGDKTLSLKLFSKACNKGSRLACDRLKKEKALERLRNQKEEDRIETI